MMRNAVQINITRCSLAFWLSVKLRLILMPPLISEFYLASESLFINCTCCFHVKIINAWCMSCILHLFKMCVYLTFTVTIKLVMILLVWIASSVSWTMKARPGFFTCPFELQIWYGLAAWHSVVTVCITCCSTKELSSFSHSVFCVWYDSQNRVITSLKSINTLPYAFVERCLFARLTLPLPFTHFN
jgi:hypothetical protein